MRCSACSQSIRVTHHCPHEHKDDTPLDQTIWLTSCECGKYLGPYETESCWECWAKNAEPTEIRVGAMDEVGDKVDSVSSYEGWGDDYPALGRGGIGFVSSPSSVYSTMSTAVTTPLPGTVREDYATRTVSPVDSVWKVSYFSRPTSGMSDLQPRRESAPAFLGGRLVVYNGPLRMPLSHEIDTECNQRKEKRERRVAGSLGDSEEELRRIVKQVE